MSVEFEKASGYNNRRSPERFEKKEKRFKAAEAAH